MAAEHAPGRAVARVATVSTRPVGPAELLRRLVASDPGRPRITVYDDTESATRGERVELSARVLANWVAKAANLLQDDLDLGPGTVVVLDLPPHWRTLYWALAVWSVGGCVEVPERRTGDAGGAPTEPDDPDDVAARGADLVVTDAVDVASGADESVLVTLAALARSALGPGAAEGRRRGPRAGDARRRLRRVGPAGAGRPGAALGRRHDDDLRRAGARRVRAAPNGCTRRRPTPWRSSAWPWTPGPVTARSC